MSNLEETVHECLDNAVASGYDMHEWTDEAIASDLQRYAGPLDAETTENIIPHIATWKARHV